MKIDILDTAMNPKGMSYFDLKKEINYLQDEKGAQIKDIRHISSYPGGRDYVVAILYEEPSIIQQKSFYTRGYESEINKFLACHDVIKVDHTGRNRDDSGIITTVVYRKRIIEKSKPDRGQQDEKERRTKK